MTTYYVNINDSYIASGDGSMGNQFNFYQFQTSLTVNGSDTYLLQGVHTGGGADPPITFAPNGNKIVDAQDITQPWRIIPASGLADSTFEAANGDVNFSNGIYDNDLTGGGGIQFGNGSTLHDVILKNMYIVGTYLNIDSRYINVSGSNLISTSLQIAFNTEIIGSSVSHPMTVINTILSSALNWIIFEDDNSTGTSEFTNCVTTNPFSDIHLVLGTAFVNVANNQYSWTPRFALPNGSATGVNFFEQHLAPDGSIYDITASALAPFTGYEKGLFGGNDRTISHGIGAFTFGTPAPPTPVPALLAPAWQAGTYATNIVVAHSGAFWISNTTTSSVPGADGTWVQYVNAANIITLILNLFNQT